MKYFSAQYIFTNAGPPVKRGIVTTEDDGTIVSIEDSGGDLPERHSLEFHNGIIVPGFVNCHCHLELSYLKNEIPESTGLVDFLRSVNSLRYTLENDSEHAINEADSEMLREGIVLCADICNNSSTFNLKKETKIKYISLLEVFGIDPSRAEARMNEINQLAETAEKSNLPYWIVPHALYSISTTLLRLIKKNIEANLITSIHFMESPEEIAFLERRSGKLMEYYKEFLPSFSEIQMVSDFLHEIKEVRKNGKLILVHNTFITREVINDLKNLPDLFWCLCPESNLYIEQKIPPVDLLAGEGCNIVIGTDSLSSNSSLSIIKELKAIQKYFPTFSLETLIRWATINGAKALGEETVCGSIEPGKKPGIVLLQNIDLVNKKFLPGSTARRLI